MKQKTNYLENMAVFPKSEIHHRTPRPNNLQDKKKVDLSFKWSIVK